MLLFILLFLCLILLILYLKFNNNNYWKNKNIVQVNGLFWEFMFGNRSLAEIYKKVYDSHPMDANIGIFLGTRPALILKDIDNVQAVLAGDFQSFYSRGIRLNPNDTLGDNVLFINDYGRWKILRQKLSPVFTSSKLKNMFYILDRCAQDFVKRIGENPKTAEKPFDTLYTYTTSSIAASIFGIDTKIENTMDSPFLDMARKSLSPSLKVNISTTISNTFPTLASILNLKVFGEYEDFFIGVVREVLESRKNSKEKRHDFIDICLELQEQGTMKDDATGYELKPTVEILAAQAFFFFIAGADTSASSMHFTLLELSNNPDILKKVHHEIDVVFRSCDEKLTYNKIDELQYLEMVYNEAMRKYPPIGLIQRLCTKNTTLPVGKIEIEKDCLIVLPVFAIHRDEEYYPNPDIFDPERFSPENVAKLPKYAYLPFGEGNRICLGMRMARIQVLTGLAWLLRRFTLRSQSFVPSRFEPSAFALRLPDARYDLVPRDSIYKVD